MGWEATGVFKPNKWLGVAADFSDIMAARLAVASICKILIRTPSVASGPHLALCHMCCSAGTRTAAFLERHGVFFRDWGGVDLKLNRLASIRLVKVDYLLTRSAA